MKYARKDNLSTKSCSLSQNWKITREIAQNAKSCSKSRREVAKKLPGNLWKALTMSKKLTRWRIQGLNRQWKLIGDSV